MTTQYRFLGKRKLMWFVISLVLLILGVAALFTWRIPLGIDFKGGAVLEIQFNQTVAKDNLKSKLESYPEVRGVSIIESEGGVYLIKMLPISDGEYKEISSKLKTDLGEYTEKQYQSVGPSVSQDLTRKSVIAVVLASVLILFYLAYSFRTVAYPVSSWKFGATALIALLHDLIITAGIFSILAHFLHYELDSSFITALLTVMGFSVHDTIVVFDRIRENLSRRKITTADEFEQVTETSLAETLNRSICTSLTVLFTLGSMALIGGQSIRPFVLTLFSGVAIGAYSSIFTATPLLVIWQNHVFKKLASQGQTIK